MKEPATTGMPANSNEEESVLVKKQQKQWHRTKKKGPKDKHRKYQ